ncbi:MAG: MBL fold metallo-hydrolase [Euryarchaeota archaeon]|nr:MBL fold metallo-hydrolase [Euryarchaeota archaeon]MDE1837053.1 MBL fold metallo-hydrolase [Euryarchaeota archaeon]MDE1880984.1 MBL fold metallo-hydrolase [Euryarchaeota archaeon]MDE2046381.1 MBL fold metallo-hydrolase [Thermoplasmata archaeon]
MPEILPGVHLVEGVNPSPDFTTNVLLLKDAKGATWTLLDTGLPPGKAPTNAIPQIESYLARHGTDLSAVRNILITHLHADHTGNLKELARRTGAKVFAGREEAEYLEGRKVYTGPGMPPPDRVDIHEKLKDGDTIDLFEGLVALATPGHTPGHTSYYCPSRRVLFPGDSVFNVGGKIAVSLKEYTFSPTLAISSLRREAGLDVESVVMYHGAPVLSGGGAMLRSAAQSGYP